jgi:phosphoglycolate phosphatase
MDKICNVIFDFDGTIIDSKIDIRESLKQAILEINGQCVENLSFRIGPPLESIINSIFPDISSDKVEKIVTTFRSIYSNCGFNNTFCYEGIENLLYSLKKNDFRLFIATNKPGYLTLSILKKLGLNIFDDICTVDTLSNTSISKKDMISLLIGTNSLLREKTFMVGDSTSDIRAAQVNSIASIGVGYGYEPGNILLEAKPDFYFDTVAQLTDFLIIIK